jgi:hypothetical protein
MISLAEAHLIDHDLSQCEKSIEAYADRVFAEEPGVNTVPATSM